MAAAAPPPPAAATASSTTNPLFGRPTLVELPDGRQFEGVLTSFDGSGNILLHQVTEYKPFKSTVDGEVLVSKRSVVSIVVPFKHIKALYQRDASSKEPPAAAPAAIEAPAA